MRKGFLVLVLACLTNHCFSQGFVSAWEKRVRVTSSQQPGWAVPVFTPSSGLVQLIRFDAIRQYTPTHTATWNLDWRERLELDSLVQDGVGPELAALHPAQCEGN